MVFRLDMAQKIEHKLRLATLGAEMEVGQEDGAIIMERRGSFGQRGPRR